MNPFPTPGSIPEVLAGIFENMPDVLVAMGSQSDWKKDQKDGTWQCCEILKKLGVNHRAMIISAHRTPDRLAEVAERIDGKVKVVVAAAGGAAHLPGMLQAKMYKTVVVGLPIKSSTLNGVDSLYSIVQMPAGIPVATMSIGGAENAAIEAAMILGFIDTKLQKRVVRYRKEMSDNVEYLPT